MHPEHASEPHRQLRIKTWCMSLAGQSPKRAAPVNAPRRQRGICHVNRMVGSARASAAAAGRRACASGVSPPRRLENALPAAYEAKLKEYAAKLMQGCKGGSTCKAQQQGTAGGATWKGVRARNSQGSGGEPLLLARPAQKCRKAAGDMFSKKRPSAGAGKGPRTQPGRVESHMTKIW